MKKYITLFICLMYLISTQTCLAASNLYFVKNTQKETLANIVEQGISADKNYTLRKTNPFFALTDDGKDYVLIILQTSSNNVFYYFNSSKNIKIDKEIKKIFKSRNINFEQSQNTSYISTFEKQAQKVLTNSTNNYDFQEENKITTPVATKKTDNTTLKGYVAEVQKGSTFKTYLQTPINTASATVGDNVTAILSENWIYNGAVIAPQGSVVNGSLSYARHAQYGSRNGRVAINFNQLITPEGKVYDISTEKIDFTVTNEGKLGKSVKNIAKVAAAGAVSALIIAALCSSSKNIGSAVAIGAGVGAGSALIGSVAEKGIDAEIPVYTDLDLVLLKPIRVIFNY